MRANPQFFFAHCPEFDEKFKLARRGKFDFLFGGNESPGGEIKQVYYEAELKKFNDYINELIYNSCDGRPADIEAMHRMNFFDFCMVANGYLKKVDQFIKNSKKK